MEQLKVKARAKINLTLDVLGRRETGYHDVEMIMQQINLYDVVTVSKITEQNIELTCSDGFLPTDDKNLAYKAAALMRDRFKLEMGFKIHIEKNIPVAAGLAGGSTDAAAVIKAINTLCNLNLSVKQMQELGFTLGSDIPFCFMEGCAVARGLGELLTPQRGFEHAWMVLVKPGFGVSTKEVYENLSIADIAEHPNTSQMMSALDRQSRHEILNGLCNVLETVTLKLHPKVSEVKSMLASYGADGVMMSGSGPTVFGFFNNYDRAKSAHKTIKKHYPQSYVVMTYNG